MSKQLKNQAQQTTNSPLIIGSKNTAGDNLLQEIDKHKLSLPVQLVTGECIRRVSYTSAFIIIIQKMLL